MIPIETQYGTSLGADFQEATWEFEMRDGFRIRAGEFAIVDKSVYEKLVEAAKPLLDKETLDLI